MARAKGRMELSARTRQSGAPPKVWAQVSPGSQHQGVAGQFCQFCRLPAVRLPAVLMMTPEEEGRAAMRAVVPENACLLFH